MNLEHPEDFAPLPYASGLALGLLLILGLPRESTPAGAEKRNRRVACPSPLAQVDTPVADPVMPSASV